MSLCLLRVAMLPVQAGLPQEPDGSPARRGPFEAVPEAPRPVPLKLRGAAIVAIEFRGAKRVPQSALRVVISSRVGGSLDPETLRLDVESLLRTGRFTSVGWKVEVSRSGPILHFVVVERPLIQSIEYLGNDEVTTAEILARLEQRKVKLRVETLCDENELKLAEVAVQELLAERGIRGMAVTPYLEPIWQASEDRSGPPSTVRVVFRTEGK